MKKLIKILKDTPFHTAGTKLSITDFRAAYGWICTTSTTDEQLWQYLAVGWKVPANQVREYQKNIGDWFEVVGEWDLEPLAFVHEDLWYVKDFDGMYAVFVSPIFYKEYKTTGLHCIKRVTIPEVRRLITDAKYKQQILYCTNDVNKQV